MKSTKNCIISAFIAGALMFSSCSSINTIVTKQDYDEMVRNYTKSYDSLYIAYWGKIKSAIADGKVDLQEFSELIRVSEEFVNFCDRHAENVFGSKYHRDLLDSCEYGFVGDSFLETYRRRDSLVTFMCGGEFTVPCQPVITETFLLYKQLKPTFLNEEEYHTFCRIIVDALNQEIEVRFNKRRNIQWDLYMYPFTSTQRKYTFH